MQTCTTDPSSTKKHHQFPEDMFDDWDMHDREWGYQISYWSEIYVQKGNWNKYLNIYFKPTLNLLVLKKYKTNKLVFVSFIYTNWRDNPSSDTQDTRQMIFFLTLNRREVEVVLGYIHFGRVGLVMRFGRMDCIRLQNYVWSTCGCHKMDPLLLSQHFPGMFYVKGNSWYQSIYVNSLVDILKSQNIWQCYRICDNVTMFEYVFKSMFGRWFLKLSVR